MDMTAHTASDIAGANIRAFRKHRGLSVAQLAERCALIGGAGEHLTAAVIENIEHGRRRKGERTRDITIDELSVIAGALGLGPAVLLPQLANTMEYEDDDRLIIMTTMLGNIDATRRMLEQMAASMSTAIPTAAALTITPVFGSAAVKRPAPEED